MAGIPNGSLSAPTLFQALALHNSQWIAEASSIYRQLLGKHPDDPRLLHLLGVAECQLGNPAAGITLYQRLLRLHPTHLKGLVSMAEAHKDLGRYQQALRYYDAALAQDCALELIAGERLHMQMHLHDWSAYEASLEALETLLAAGTPAAAPMITHALFDSPARLAQCAATFTNLRFPAKAQSVRLPPNARGERIRIGYFSSDFYSHPVSHLIVGMLEAHDRSRFEIFCFSLHTIEDEWRQRVVAACEHFIDVKLLSPAAIAEQARSLKIDIAVDLNCHTKGNRTAIFVERAAPVQVSYIGFLGTMGAPYIDYLIADKVLVPVESQRHYSEKIVYLPSYQCNTRQVVIPGNNPSRMDAGLPAQAFVFCCFNNGYKLTPPVFNCWLEILQRVPESVLWLYVENPLARRNLCEIAAQTGVAAARLVFASRLPYASHLARLPLADLFLDTFPYNAGATASDALRMGLPVVTRCGNTFSSRMGASLLTAVGLPELVTTTVADYIDLAVRMAQDRVFSQAIKHRLKGNLATCDLFNTGKFTQSMEAAYIAMHEINQRGHAPGHIVISGRVCP